MSSIDFRTRPQSEDVLIDLDGFLDEDLPTLCDANGVEAGRSVVHLSLPPLGFDVEGDSFTLAPIADGIRVAAQEADGLRINLDRAAFSDLVQDKASTFGIHMMGRAEVVSGDLDDFIGWEPALRTLLEGRPASEPGALTFRDQDGLPLDLHQSFTLENTPEEMGHFLAEAGFLHIERAFTEEEMSLVSSELDDAIAAAERDDGGSWWARTGADEWYPARILGFNQKSQTLRGLLRNDRFTRLGTLTDDSFVQRDPGVGDSAEGLLKKVGVVEGPSDVSWHKDCAMGGHSRGCCGLTIGISVTGAGPENGELGVVAGSHRVNVVPIGIEGLDLPRLPLATRTGDITIHCSCTLHMSRPPISAERRVVYSGFSLAPRPEDQVSVVSEAESRRDRAALGDIVRDRQRKGDLSSRSASYSL